MRDAVKASRVDMVRLQSDIDAHDAEIKGLLRRNLALADSLNLPGKPS